MSLISGGGVPKTAQILPKPPAGLWGEVSLRIYLCAMAISLTGMMLDMQVRSMLIRDLASSVEDASFWIGLTSAVGFFPGILISPFAGGLCDRMSIKNVLRATGVVQAAQAFVLTYFCFTGTISISWVIALAFVMGIVRPIDAVARNSIIPLLPENEDNVRPANQVFTSLYNVAQVVGPGCGAMLLVHIRYTGVFFLNGLSYVVLILALFKIHHASRVMKQLKKAHTKPRNTRRDLQEGARCTFSHPGIRICIIMTIITALLWFGLYPIFNIIAEEFYKGTPGMVKKASSMLSGVGGAGSFCGILLSMYLVKRIRIWYVYSVGTVLMGLGLLMFAYTPSIMYGCAAVFFTGACFMGPFSVLRSTIPHLAKNHPTLMGAIMGYTLMCFFGSLAVGGLVMGSMVKHYHCHNVVITVSILSMITGVVAWFLPSLKKLE